MPLKKRNMSTLVTNIETTSQTQNACCKANNQSSSKLCKDCLSFILNSVNIKENVKKTVRKSCMSVRSSTNKNFEQKKTLKVK